MQAAAGKGNGMSIKIEYASIAQCRPEHVWQVFAQVERWPRWDPAAMREVRWVSGEPWTTGARFSIEMLKPVPFTLTPEVLAIEPPGFVHLLGEGSGVSGEQSYFFQAMPDAQATEMRTVQEFKGGPIEMFGSLIQPGIEAGIRRLFTRIIEEAEALARAELPASLPVEPSPAE
jgi:hypothetical protein